MRPWEMTWKEQPKQEGGSMPWEQNYADPEVTQLMSDEGFRSTKYKDILGFETIGYGSAITGGRKIPDKLDKETAYQWLLEDTSKARKTAQKVAPNAPKEVQDILTNMTYQLGENGLKGFKRMLSAVNSGDYQTAAKEMLDSTWASKQTPERAARLAERMAGLGGETTNS